jgi:hypothetical protein
MSKDMCQADSSVKGDPVSEPSVPLQAENCAEAVKQALFHINIALFHITLIEHDDADLGTWLLGAITALNHAKDHLFHPPRPMVGILTPEQFEQAMTYDGPEYLGQIEEPQRGDTVTAEQREAGLTQKICHEIIGRRLEQGCTMISKDAEFEIEAAISSALSTSYEEGRRDEAIARRLAFEEAMRAAKDPTPIPASKAYCAFCGQGDAEVGMDNLVEGPTVCICEFCVENALLVLNSRKASANA